jgi:hypothetical protein
MFYAVLFCLQSGHHLLHLLQIVKTRTIFIGASGSTALLLGTTKYNSKPSPRQARGALHCMMQWDHEFVPSHDDQCQQLLCSEAELNPGGRAINFETQMGVAGPRVQRVHHAS